MEGDKIGLYKGIEQQILIIIGHLGVILAVIAQLTADVLRSVASQPDQHLRLEGLKDKIALILCQFFHQQGLQTAHISSTVVLDLDEQGHLAVHQRQHFVHSGNGLLGSQQPQLFQVPEGPAGHLTGNAGHALELQIVKHDQLIVGSNANVQFDGMAALHRQLKGGKRVFGHALILIVQAPVGHQFVSFNEIGSLPLGHKNPSTYGFL